MKNKKIKKIVLILLVLVSLAMLAVIIQQTIWYLTEGGKKFDVGKFFQFIYGLNKKNLETDSFRIISHGDKAITPIWDILWKPVALAHTEQIKTNTNFYIILMVISSAVFIVTTALSSYVIYELLKARQLNSKPLFKTDALGNNVL